MSFAGRLTSIGGCLLALALALGCGSIARAGDEDPAAGSALEDAAATSFKTFEQEIARKQYDNARAALSTLKHTLDSTRAGDPRVTRRLNELREQYYFRNAQTWWYEAGLDRSPTGEEPRPLLCKVMSSALDYLSFWGNLGEAAQAEMPRYEDFAGVASPGRAASMSARISNVASDYLKVPQLLILVFSDVDAASLGPEALGQWYDTLIALDEKTKVIELATILPPDLQKLVEFVSPRSLELCEALQQLESRDETWVKLLVAQHLLGQLKQARHEQRRAKLRSRFNRTCKPESR